MPQISGVGNIVAVHSGAGAIFTYHGDVTKWPFLVCVIYFDESGDPYQQAFRYRATRGAPTSIGLEVLSESKYTDVCP
jgi:hypothetical protein